MILLYHIQKPFQFWNTNQAKSRGRLIRAVNLIAADLRKSSGVPVKAKHTSSQGLTIISQPVIINGWHYRGSFNRDKWTLNLHNGVGWPGSTKPFADDDDEQGLGLIFWHEIGHMLGLAHDGNKLDLMFPNVGHKLIGSRARFNAYFSGRESTATKPTECHCHPFTGEP